MVGLALRNVLESNGEDRALKTVVHIVRQFTPSRGGLEDTVANLCRHQREIGWHPRVVTLNRLFQSPHRVLSGHEVIDGVQVTRIPFRGSRRYPVAPAILRHLDDADIVHVHGIDFFFDFLALTRPIHHKRLIATTHGGFFHTSFASRLKTVYFATITRLAASRYDRIVACSEHDAETFKRISKRVVSIENGVDVDKFRGCASPVPTKTMIYFGRIAPNKNISAAIDFVVNLRKRDDWRLIIAGTQDGENIFDLQSYANRVGAIDIRFVPSPSNRDLVSLIGEASYFISMSSYEGFGIAAVEAMSAGLVPILSDIPTHRRLIEESGSGVLVDPKNLTQAEGAVIAARIDQSGAIYARRFDWKKIAQQYVQVYEAAIVSA